MARKATVILEIVPDASKAQAAISKLAKDAGQAAGGKGKGASGNKSGTGGLSADERTVLQARKRIVDANARSEINQTLAVDKVKEQTAKDDLKRIGEIERKQIQTAQHYKSVQAQKAMADKEAAKQAKAAAQQQEKAARDAGNRARQIAKDAIKTEQDRAKLVEKIVKDRVNATKKAADEEYKAIRSSSDKIKKLEMDRDKVLSKIRNPQARSEAEGIWQQRIDSARNAANPLVPPGGNNKGGFLGSFMGGWGKAGGFGSAFGTVTKYFAAYKMMEAGQVALTAPFIAAKNAIVGATEAYVDYEQEMADASRTFYQPGFSTKQLTGIMGEDALKFMTKYRVELSEVAKAQYELGSANFNVKDILQAYQTPLKVNIALNGDITETTRVMTQMLKIHGKQMGDNMTTQQKMSRIGGVLLKTWQIEQVELSDIIDAYKYVAGSAATMNIKLEELVPTLGFLSTYGLRGSIGGTGLNQFFTQTAKNIKITKDQAVMLEKATRGKDYKIDLGLKTGDLKSPMQILIQMAKAVQSMPKNLAGRMQIAQAYADLFNIRGARPAQLLADLERLGGLMKNIGDVSKMSTADMDKFVNQMVAIRQNTVEGQLQLYRNNIYNIGVEFIKAATGGDTLVDSIKRIITWLQQIKPVVIQIGYKFGGEVAAGTEFIKSLSEGKGLVVSNRRANAAGIGFQMDAIKSRISASASKQAIDNDEQAWDSWRKQQTHAAYAYLSRLMGKAGISLDEAKERTSWWQDKVHGGQVGALESPTWAGKGLGKWKELSEREMVLAVMSYEGWRSLEYKDVYDKAKQLRDEQSARNPANQIKDALGDNPSLTSTDKDSKKGSGQSDAESNFRKMLDGLTDSLDYYEDKLHRVSVALRTLGIQEDRTQRLMQNGVVTYARIAEAEAQTAEKIKLLQSQSAWLGMQVQASSDRASIFEGKAKSAPTEDLKKQANDKARELRNHSLDLIADQLAVQEQINQAQRRPVEVRNERVKQQYQFRLDDFNNLMRDKNIVIDEVQKSISNVDRQENLFGVTVDSTTQKIQLFNKAILLNRNAFGQAQEALEKTEKTYKALESIRREIRDDNVAGPMSPDRADTLRTAMGLDSLEDAYAAVQKDGSAFPYLNEEVPKLKGDVDSMRSAVLQYADAYSELQSNATSARRAILSIPLDRQLDSINQKMDVQQALFTAQGKNWDTSADKVGFINQQIDVTSKKLATLPALYAAGLISLSQYSEDWAKFNGDVTKYTADRDDATRRARESVTRDLEQKIRETKSSWKTGVGREDVNRQIVAAMQAAKAEMKDLREQYEGQSWAKPILDDYENVLKVDAIMKPWMTAREKIQERFSSMFQDLFSNLIGGGEKPWSAAGKSIVNAIQGEMVDSFVKKYLGSLFDQMASKETGIDGAKVREASASDQVSASFQILNASTINATNALNGFAATVAGGGAGTGAGMAGGIIASLTPMAAGVSKTTTDAIGAQLGIGSSAATPKNKVKQSDWAHFGDRLSYYVSSALTSYSQGSMIGGLMGSLTGKDPESSAMYGGLGAIAGSFLGPVGTVVGGLIGGLFGKKKKKNTDPRRDIYGMPAFEYDSYMYNLYKTKSGISDVISLGSDTNHRISSRAESGVSTVVSNRSVGSVTVNVNGGDTKQVQKVVNDALNANFGALAVAGARSSSW